jgi:hypothetical protein
MANKHRHIFRPGYDHCAVGGCDARRCSFRDPVRCKRVCLNKGDMCRTHALARAERMHQDLTEQQQLQFEAGREASANQCAAEDPDDGA